MAGSDLSDFLRIPFISQILLFLLGIGILYVALIVFIFRRAAARRRKRRETLASGTGLPKLSPSAVSGTSMPLGNFLRGQLPEKPLPPAEWTVPAELRSLPEPDLDMLTMPLSAADYAPAENAAQETVEGAKSIHVTEGQSWVSAVVPVEESAREISMAATNVEGSGQASKNIDLGDAVEVMRVWRDLSDGSLIIQMGDQRYRNVAEIQNQDLARRFTAVVRELWAMINNGARPGITGNESTGPAVGPSMKSRMGLLNAEPEPQRQSVLKAVTKQALGQSTAPQADQPSGIANAVEDFLQFKLSTTPQFNKRSIHFRSSHDLGVRIEVDGHYYDAIGDVVDPDVRDFLQELMREWEARH